MYRDCLCFSHLSWMARNKYIYCHGYRSLDLLGYSHRSMNPQRKDDTCMAEIFVYICTYCCSSGTSYIYRCWNIARSWWWRSASWRRSMVIYMSGSCRYIDLSLRDMVTSYKSLRDSSSRCAYKMSWLRMWVMM